MELNARGVAKYSDFGPVEGYISETVQESLILEVAYELLIGAKLGDLE